MKLNIIIPTRNPKRNQCNFLHILKSNLPLNKLIIINDSTNENPILKKEIKEVSDKIIIIDNIFLNRAKIPLTLGPKSWNLGMARNIGMLISLFYSDKDTKTCFFDDDVFLKKINVVNLKKIFNKEKINLERTLKYAMLYGNKKLIAILKTTLS